MTSPVKLPPLPPIPWAVLGGIANDCVSAEAIHNYATAYAEQAVRQALAAQEPVAWIPMVNGKPVDRPSRDLWLMERSALSWEGGKVFGLALISGDDSGHKPAPMDTSSGHNADKEPPCSPTSSTGQSQ